MASRSAGMSGSSARGGRRLHGGDAAEHLQAVGAGEGGLAGEQVVERGAQAVDVRAPVQPGHLAPGLLGRHVVGRAQHRAGGGDALARVQSRARPKSIT